MALTAHAAWGNTESRLALIIGNSSYKSSPLRNPVNDVRLMEQSLKDAGFTVLKAENASLRDMRRLVRDFGEKLKANGGVGLFYFAGHGVQVRGENYLVSVDSDIRAEDEVAEDSVNTSLVLEKMQTAGNRMNIVILDACRNNPFAASSRSAVNGLAAVNAPSGTLVAYSTSPGSVAYDGVGANSLYTQYLASALRQPGSRIEDVFKDVRAAVRKETGNKQTPWENTALEGQFYFKPALPSQPADAVVALASASITASNASEIAFWDSVKNSPNSAELQTYIAQYPQGSFVSLSKARIEYLRSVQVVSPNSSLGTLELTQILYKTKSSLEVKVDQQLEDRTIYSTGDVVAKDGTVLVVRVGNIILRTVSGKLWNTSSKVGTSGQAGVQWERSDGLSLGNINWNVVSGQNGSIKIEAKVDYVYSGSRNAGASVFGSWTASYPPGNTLPESTLSAIRSTGFSELNNFVSTVLKAK